MEFLKVFLPKVAYKILSKASSEIRMSDYYLGGAELEVQNFTIGEELTIARSSNGNKTVGYQ